MNGYADQPRIVQHVDEIFRQKVTQVYRQYIPANGVVLDLMSSWVSHLPKEASYSLVVGHGMNAQEVLAPATVRLPKRRLFLRVTWLQHVLELKIKLPCAGFCKQPSMFCIHVCMCGMA